MLRLLSLLQSGRRWPSAELANSLESTSRTLRRDIEQLRALGYRVESVRGPGGYYQLIPGKALPPLMFEDDEAVATVLGLKLAASGDAGIEITDAAERAINKLHRVLPPPLILKSAGLISTVDLGSARHPLTSAELLDVCVVAISKHQFLQFTYESNNRVRYREVEPIRLLRQRERWYLFAWDPSCKDWRTFRLDRISGTAKTGGTFSPRAAPATDLFAYLNDRMHTDPIHTIELVLYASVADAASRLYRIDGSLEPLGTDSCTYCARVDSFEWMALVLLFSGVEFTVTSPETFSIYLREQASRFFRATNEGSSLNYSGSSVAEPDITFHRPS